MATAQAFLTAKDNKPDMQIINHFMYANVRDGDMMAGVAHEAAAFAGNNKLSSLIFFYDNKKITIDGSTDITLSDDAAKRFEAYGRHVQHVKDVNNLNKFGRNSNMRAKRKKHDRQSTKLVSNSEINVGKKYI